MPWSTILAGLLKITRFTLLFRVTLNCRKFDVRLVLSALLGGDIEVPLTLVLRSGTDSLGKLEASSLLRMREAESLFAEGHRLGAIYLYG